MYAWQQRVLIFTCKGIILRRSSPQKLVFDPMASESSLDALLSKNRSIVLDGALATELEARGLDLSSALWSAKILQEDPNSIFNVHLDYYRAGADVATTASYQATFAGLNQHLGISKKGAKDLITKSVQLAQRARGVFLEEQRSDPHSAEPLLVAGSVGPYGAFLSNGAEYTGDYVVDNSAMKDFHRSRIQNLVDAGVDILACETMPNFAEIESLLQMLEDEFPATRAWLSCTIRDSEHLSDGTPIAKVSQLVDTKPQIIAIGFNCIPEQDISSALKHLQSLTTKSLVAYPNSGEHWNAKERKWEGERAEGQTFAQLVKDWNGSGASLIGGCCRTNPSDIRTIREALE